MTVTTEAVLQTINDYSGPMKDGEGQTVFSTRDIADKMGCDEYAVRAAFSWLCKTAVIEAVQGTACVRRTRRTGEPYTAMLYRVKPKAQPADFDALFLVFGLSGRRL